MTATKLGTTNKLFVVATKNFAAATKSFVHRTKHFVVVTKYFYPYFNKCFRRYNKTFFRVREVTRLQRPTLVLCTHRLDKLILIPVLHSPMPILGIYKLKRELRVADCKLFFKNNLITSMKMPRSGLSIDMFVDKFIF